MVALRTGICRAFRREARTLGVFAVLFSLAIVLVGAMMLREHFRFKKGASRAGNKLVVAHHTPIYIRRVPFAYLPMALNGIYITCWVWINETLALGGKGRFLEVSGLIIAVLLGWTLLRLFTPPPDRVKPAWLKGQKV